MKVVYIIEKEIDTKNGKITFTITDGNGECLYHMEYKLESDFSYPLTPVDFMEASLHGAQINIPVSYAEQLEHIREELFMLRVCSNTAEEYPRSLGCILSKLFKPLINIFKKF